MEIKQIEEFFSGREPEYIGRHACFSVLIPLVRIDDSIEVLFEKRSSKIKRQPGEICFPGGMKENGESDRDCAIRETSEELGIEYRHIHMGPKVGTLNTYGGYIIQVYSGEIACDVLKNASPSEIEVEELFTVPLDFFLNESPQVYKAVVSSEVEDGFPYDVIGFPDGYPWKKTETDIPVYVYENHVIWGITGRIIRYFADALKEGILK